MESKDVHSSVYLQTENSEVTDYSSNSNKLQNSRSMQSILSLGYRLDVSKFHFRQGKKRIFCSTWLVTSKCFRNHIISEKYKTVKSFKLHFLQNSSIVQLDTSTGDYKRVGKIPGSHFAKAFSAPPSHS